MALKTIRVCEVCKAESDPDLVYIDVRLSKVNEGGYFLAATYEVCSDNCAMIATQNWVKRNERLEREEATS